MSIIKKLRARITSAHVIAMIALFVALSGSSYAAVTIRASQIKNNSIPGAKIKAGSIPASKLRNNSITGAKLKNNTVGRAKLRTDALNPTAGGGNLINANSESDDDSSSGARGPQGPSGPRGLTGATGSRGRQRRQRRAGCRRHGLGSRPRHQRRHRTMRHGAAFGDISCPTGQALYSVNARHDRAGRDGNHGRQRPTGSTISGAAEGVRIDVYGSVQRRIGL